MSKFWGYHAMLDCAGCDNGMITNPSHIVDFIKTLVQRIDMVAYGEPIIEHFATHDPDKAGYSVVQLIETSNICAHFVDKDNTLYLDVFSCKTFEVKVVEDSVREFFAAQNVRTNFVTRHASL